MIYAVLESAGSASRQQHAPTKSLGNEPYPPFFATVHQHGRRSSMRQMSVVLILCCGSVSHAQTSRESDLAAVARSAAQQGLLGGELTNVLSVGEERPRYAYRIDTEGLSSTEERAFRAPHNRATVCGRRDSQPRPGRFRLVIGTDGRVQTVEPVRPRNDAVTRCLLIVFAELRFWRRPTQTSIVLSVTTSRERNNIRPESPQPGPGTIVYRGTPPASPQPIVEELHVRGVLTTASVEAVLRRARFSCEFTEADVRLVVRNGRVVSIRSNVNECATRTLEQLRFDRRPGTTQVEFRLVHRHASPTKMAN